MSRGRGIGQQTGGDEYGDALEAQRILKIIADVSVEDIYEHVGVRAGNLIRDMRTSLAFGVSNFRVTGKQLFFMREVKDSLIEKGLI